MSATTVSSCRSDVPSPVTPTFSQGHSRYASSTSSLEMVYPFISDCNPSPITISHKPGKRSLPDVQEDPLEQDGEDTMIEEKIDLYSCLCDEDYCVHREDPQIVASPLSAHSEDYADYELGLCNDGEPLSSPKSPKTKRWDGVDSLSGISRFSSRLPSLSRFRSSKRVNLPVSPTSDLSLDSYLSRDPSRSRSSSVSTSARHHVDRIPEYPIPPTPALSFLESSESVCAAQPIDIEKSKADAALEKDRSMATTPLLPPLMTGIVACPVQQFKAQSHKSSIPPPTAQSEHPTTLLPSPPLSSKPSVTEFRLPAPSGFPSMAQDAWSDRLGHANFTILPRPYEPEQKNMDTLRQLRANWDEARIAYGKHIARIGEHYGHTSNTYNLTEAKWRETQQEWQSIHDTLIDQIVDSAKMEDHASERVPTTVPKLHAMGDKFPSRGDEDIVGPMMRAVTMLPASGTDERRNGRFWRNLAGKVGLRR